jgi:hypothetical protein
VQNCANSKPGPKPDPFRAYLRNQMRDFMSDRTFATYWRAFRTFSDLVEMGAITDAERRAAMIAALRPNGDINVSKFARMADQELMKAISR